MVVANSEYKIVVFVPDLEGLFFRDKNFIEEYFGTTLSPREFEMCKRDPRGWLMELSGGKSFQNVREDMLAKMTDELQSKILEDPQRDCRVLEVKIELKSHSASTPISI